MRSGVRGLSVERSSTVAFGEKTQSDFRRIQRLSRTSGRISEFEACTEFRVKGADSKVLIEEHSSRFGKVSKVKLSHLQSLGHHARGTASAYHTLDFMTLMSTTKTFFYCFFLCPVPLRLLSAVQIAI